MLTIVRCEHLGDHFAVMRMNISHFTASETTLGMSFLVALRAFCDVYPVTYVTMILCSTFCVVPSVLLLIAVIRSSIHSNCRILMCLWILTQLLVYATVCWLAVNCIVVEKTYFKEQFNTTGVEAYILTWYLPAWLITTCFELGISLERGCSIRNPSKYHGSSASHAKIAIYFLFSVVFSFQVSKWILAGSGTVEAALGTIMSNVVDIGAFSTNGIVFIFARRKNNLEHKQLNERYQIREAYLIARAMMPVYCMSTAIKIAIIAVNWAYVMSIFPHSVNQVLYLILSEITCALMSSMFLLYHVRLRSKLDGILGRSDKIFSVIDSHGDDVTATYFQMLSTSWNR